MTEPIEYEHYVIDNVLYFPTIPEVNQVVRVDMLPSGFEYANSCITTEFLSDLIPINIHDRQDFTGLIKGYTNFTTFLESFGLME